MAGKCAAPDHSVGAAGHEDACAPPRRGGWRTPYFISWAQQIGDEVEVSSVSRRLNAERGCGSGSRVPVCFFKSLNAWRSVDP